MNWTIGRSRYALERMIPLSAVIVLGFVVSLAFWRNVVIETGLIVANQVDYEDTALCIKFGFARGTAQHDACKLDLLDLRHSDEDLIARTSLP
jgi:hypothetical protein